MKQTETAKEQKRKRLYYSLYVLMVVVIFLHIAFFQEKLLITTLLALGLIIYGVIIHLYISQKEGGMLFGFSGSTPLIIPNNKKVFLKALTWFLILFVLSLLAGYVYKMFMS